MKRVLRKLFERAPLCLLRRAFSLQTVAHCILRESSLCPPRSATHREPPNNILSHTYRRHGGYTFSIYDYFRWSPGGWKMARWNRTHTGRPWRQDRVTPRYGLLRIENTTLIYVYIFLLSPELCPGNVRVYILSMCAYVCVYFETRWETITSSYWFNFWSSTWQIAVSSTLL